MHTPPPALPHRRRRGSGLVIAIIVIVALVVIGGLVWWLWPDGSVGEAANMAPANTAGVIHVDLDAVADELDNTIDQIQQIPPQVKEMARKALPIVKDLNAVNVYLIPKDKVEPDVVAIILTDLSIKDIHQRVQEFQPDAPMPPETSEGRYEFKQGRKTFWVVDGNASGDLESGMILVSSIEPTSDFIDSLGEGSDSKTFEVAEEADTDATMWMAMEPRKLEPSSEEAPEIMAGSFSLGSLKGEAYMEFSEEKYAEKTEQEVNEARNSEMGPAQFMELTPERDGKVLRVTFESKKSLPDLINQAAAMFLGGFGGPQGPGPGPMPMGPGR